MTKDELETTVTYTSSSENVTVWTCRAPDYRRLSKDHRFLLTKHGKYEDGTVWGEFTIPASQWNPVSGAKRKRNLTDEQRQASRDRLIALRAERVA